MECSEAIRTRRSIRRFRQESVPQEIVRNVLEAGRWAPSGLNNQPWMFKVLESNEKNQLAQFTHYHTIITHADKAIMIFLNNESVYHREKDFMAIGACIQNMLLALHAYGYAGCWLGEILNQKDKVHSFFSIPSHLELAAVIALGRPAETGKKGRRKSLDSRILK